MQDGEETENRICGSVRDQSGGAVRPADPGQGQQTQSDRVDASA